MSALGQTYRSPDLWRSVWILLKLRLVIFISGIRRASGRRKFGMLVLALVVLIFLGVVLFVAVMILRFLRSSQFAQVIGEIPFTLESVPTLIVSAAFLGILLTSFGVLLQALYLAGDMDFLLSAPVPIRAVFISKMLQAVLPNFLLICLFALPVLYGIGVWKGYSLIYYPLVLVELVALALAAAGISSLLVMAVVRVFPARRVAEVLGFLGALLSFLCSQSGQLANMSEFSPEQTNQAFDFAMRLDTPWSPLAWAGRGLVGLGQGDWSMGISITFATLVLSILIFVIALSVSERLYYIGWAGMQNRRRKARAPRRERPARVANLGATLTQVLPSPVRAILVKDLIVLRRDIRNMSQLIMPLIVGVIYAIMFFRDGGPRTPEVEEMPAWAAGLFTNISVYFNVGIALFVSWMLLSRLAGMGFSQEGKSYWVLKSSPTSSARLVAGKFLVAYLPVLALSWVFLLVISLVQGANLASLLFTMPVVALCIAGNAGINLTFGIIGAKFDWEDPRRMQRGGSGCLAAIASFAYLPTSLVLFFGPAVLLTALRVPEPIGQLAGLALGGVFSLVCASVPLWLVHGRVARLAEA